MQLSLHRKTRTISGIFGALTGITMGMFPLYRQFLSPEVAFKVLTGGVVLFGITMVIMFVHLLTSPQLLAKLSVLPIGFALGFTVYINHQLNVVNRFKMMLGLDVPPEALEVNMEAFGSTMMMMQAGIWLSVLPIIGVAIFKMTKLNKRNTQDFTKFHPTRGMIKHVEDTLMRVNNIHVYKITLSIPYYEGESYEVIKEFRIPYHMLHSVAIGAEVSVLVNPKKKKDVYIETDYGIL